jgi:predicted MFS family arabinose efflux permease
MGTVFAAVPDHVPPAQRGRALGWVITGQSLSLLFGVPLVTLAGAAGGWRGALATQGTATLVSAIALWMAVPPGTPAGPRGGRPRTSLLGVSGRVLALLGAGTMERTRFAARRRTQVSR